MTGMDIFKQIKETKDDSQVSIIKKAFLSEYSRDGEVDYERLGSDLAKCITKPVEGFSNIAVSIPSILAAISSVNKLQQAVKSPTVSILLGALKGAEIPEKFGKFLSSFLKV